VRLFAHQTWGELMRCGGNGGIKATSAGPKAVFALVRDARVGVWSGPLIDLDSLMAGASCDLA